MTSSRPSSFVRYGLTFAGVIAAIATAPAVLRAASTAEVVFPELAELLRGAVTQSPRILDRNLQRLAAEQRVFISSSRLYPQVNFSGNYNLQYEDRNQAAGWEFNNRYNVGLSVSYPLFHWGALRADADIGRIQAAVAANNVVEAYRLLALELRRAYLQAVIDRATVKTVRLGDEMTRRRFAVMEQRVKSGELQSAALGGAGIGVMDSALSLDRAIRAARLSFRTLQQLSGRSDLTEETLPTAIPDVPRVSPEDALAQLDAYFAQKRFLADTRLVTVDGEIESENHRLRIAQVNQRLTVDLVSGASVDQLSYVNNIGDRTGVTALYTGLRFNWNIFDGYGTRGRIMTSKTMIRQLEMRRENLEEELRFAASQAGSELDLTGRALTIAEGRYGGAKGSYEFTVQNFERQRASQDDVENAQLGLNSLELQLFSARAAYLNAVAAWLFSINADPAVPASIAPPSS